MSLPISIVNDTIGWDSLPVFKIAHYPFAKGSYKPYTLARLCVHRGNLLARLWAFESETYIDEKDMLSGSCINLFLKKRENCLAVTVAAGGGFEAKVHTGAGFVPLYNMTKGVPNTTWFQGEDLQGVYWGCEVELPGTVIEDVFGGDCLTPGAIFLANITKTQYNVDKFHFGSLFDFRDSEPVFYSPDSLQEFTVVEY